MILPEMKTISQILALRGFDDRIHITHTVFENGQSKIMNSALKDARGRWIAFIKCGDVWEPEKLEKQISFMESNNFSFSYTKFRMISEAGVDYGYIVGGKSKVSHKDLKKCCWQCFSTVMYDVNTVGHMQVKNLWECNDYALWLKVAEYTDCYLLNECLTTQLSERNFYSPFPISNKLK